MARYYLSLRGRQPEIIHLAIFSCFEWFVFHNETAYLNQKFRKYLMKFPGYLVGIVEITPEGQILSQYANFS